MIQFSISKYTNLLLRCYRNSCINKLITIFPYVFEHLFNFRSHFADSCAFHFRLFCQYGISRFDKLIFLKESRF